MPIEPNQVVTTSKFYTRDLGNSSASAFQETGQHSHGGAFSGTIGAEKAEHFSRRNAEADAVDRLNAGSTVPEVESLPKIFQFLPQ